MKVICKIRAFWDGEIIKPGQIIDVKCKEIPCWAKPLNKKDEVEEDKKPEEKQDNPPENNKVEDKQDDKKEDEKAASEKVNPMTAQELAGKNESELDAILEELRTEALDKNIVVDAENKTVIEQINELKIKLGKAEK